MSASHYKFIYLQKKKQKNSTLQFNASTLDLPLAYINAAPLSETFMTYIIVNNDMTPLYSTAIQQDTQLIAQIGDRSLHSFLQESASYEIPK